MINPIEIMTDEEFRGSGFADANGTPVLAAAYVAVGRAVDALTEATLLFRHDPRRAAQIEATAQDCIAEAVEAARAAAYIAARTVEGA